MTKAYESDSSQSPFLVHSSLLSAIIIRYSSVNTLAAA